MDHRIIKLDGKAKLLPEKPGCYLMYNSEGQIIYVGKAKNLKSRVSSYFNQSHKTPKTEILVSHIVDFDFMMTTNDAEAYVLENNLIKKHIPKYNIRLKDDKSYPYLVVNHNEPFPRLEFIRKVKKQPHQEIFGPFVTGSNIFEVLRVITKFLGLRDCSLSDFKKRKEPCLLYQMRQCTAPCVKKITSEEYDQLLNLALDPFKSHGQKLMKKMEERMVMHGESEEFESAIFLREDLKKIRDLVNVFRQENAEYASDLNLDIVAYFQGEEEVDITIYMMRKGILLGHKNFFFSNLDITEELEDEVLNFMFQYYLESHDVLPEKIVTSFSAEKIREFENALNEVYKSIKVSEPIGSMKSLFELTRDHALEEQRVRHANRDSVYVGLHKLKELLGLKERPVVLECFDIAIFQGSSPTAAQIVFHDGVPDKKSYRHYTLAERPEGNNDFHMMKEVLERRMDNGKLPDVFVIDGGIGQVNMVLAVMQECQIQIPVVGIAKSKVMKEKGSFQKQTIQKSEERLIIPGRKNPFLLSQNKSLFKILTQMRDEAHRFSRRLHHKHEKKRVIPKTQKKVN